MSKPVSQLYTIHALRGLEEVMIFFIRFEDAIEGR